MSKNQCFDRTAVQAILDGDYPTSLAALEAWVESGGPERERDFARLASLTLSRLERLVSIDDVGQEQAEQAKALQLRLETGRVA